MFWISCSNLLYFRNIAYSEHNIQIKINAQINCSLKPDIISPLSDAAILKCKFIYLSGIKSKRFTNFVHFHTGC